jgi:hypothetical protein
MDPTGSVVGQASGGVGSDPSAGIVGQATSQTTAQPGVAPVDPSAQGQQYVEGAVSERVGISPAGPTVGTNVGVTETVEGDVQAEAIARSGQSENIYTAERVQGVAASPEAAAEGAAMGEAYERSPVDPNEVMLAHEAVEDPEAAALRRASVSTSESFSETVTVGGSASGSGSAQPAPGQPAQPGQTPAQPTPAPAASPISPAARPGPDIGPKKK